MNLRSILLLLVILGSCNQNNSSKNYMYVPNQINKQNKKDYPKIKFSKLNYDFGILKKGDVISDYIIFKNDGEKDLIISNVKSSCGCTVAEWPKNPISANQYDSLFFKLNTSLLNGKISKNITIITNSIPNTKVITINAQIK